MYIISVFCVVIVGVFQAHIIYVELAINRTSIASDARLTVCIGYTAVIYILHNFFSIHVFVHRYSILIRSNKMQRYAGIYLLQNHSAHVSGVHRTHHQECMKM